MHCNACYNVIQHGRLIRMYVLCTYFLNLPSLKNFYPITRLSAYYYHYQPIVQYHVKKSFLSPSPFPLDFGFGIWDLDLGPGFGIWISDLDLGLDLSLTIKFNPIKFQACILKQLETKKPNNNTHAS